MDKILDAREMWGVRSAGELLRYEIISLGKRGKSVLLEGDGLPARSKTVEMYVSDGRWVANCPACNGGIPHVPDADWALCPDCGKGYRVKYPKSKSRIEAILLKRPQLNRHYLLGESVADLEAQNLAHGLEV